MPIQFLVIILGGFIALFSQKKQRREQHYSKLMYLLDFYRDCPRLFLNNLGDILCIHRIIFISMVIWICMDF